MTGAPVIQGWCPGALRPMQSGDGLVVRVRPRGGRLSPDQAAGLADLAARHGNGLIDLSARANVQLRGVTTASHPALIAGLGALGLLDATPQAESARNIVVTPFWLAQDGTQELAHALMQALASPAVPPLPGKFGYAIDTGAAPVLRDVSADIRIEQAMGGLFVWADGAATGTVVSSPDAAISAVHDLITWFVLAGGITNRRGRMAALIARGAIVPSRFQADPVPLAVPFQPRPGMLPQGAMVGFEFGQLQAQTLGHLARLGPMRLTPWRMILVEGAQVLPDIPGLITRADDPLLRVVACTGAPGCKQAHQPTRALARRLAQLWPAGLLHVSGCAKGCAHPGAAQTTLVATPEGFDLIRNGTAAAAPTRRGLTPQGVTHFLTESRA
jgi:precorrin-3B synthase